MAGSTFKQSCKIGWYFPIFEFSQPDQRLAIRLAILLQDTSKSFLSKH
jgi:hypothetical protein